MRKYSSPLIIIAAVAASVLTFMFFGPWKQAAERERKLAAHEASYKEKPLPRAPLIELQSGDDYSERARHGDVLLIYLMEGCDACQKELQTLAENGPEIDPGVRVYGVMFQDRESVGRYVQKYNINFPILLDEGGELRRALGVKYFPTNFKLSGGTIKEAWLGFPNAKEDFLRMVNVRRG